MNESACLFVCVSVYRINYKVVNGFRRIFLDGQFLGQGRTWLNFGNEGSIFIVF